ncbi:MAG: FkbM family methyltransferase [Burkholderiales bacterium]
MKNTVVAPVRALLRGLGLNVTKYSTHVRSCEVIEALLLENEALKGTVARTRQNLEFLIDIPDRQLLAWVMESQAQLWQDLFVLHELDMKRDGFFVEFGATNGVSLSNTFLLEKQFGWKGILAEPARCWHTALEKNRSAAIEKKCVWSKSGEVLMFNETEVAELSTINAFNDTDSHAMSRTQGTNYPVETISLNDLLRRHGAPTMIDYLSIDTEGSELEILSHFDFSEFRFKIITCEHNGTEAREKIFDLLTANGYVRKHTELSKFDDWYVLE